MEEELKDLEEDKTEKPEKVDAPDLQAEENPEQAMTISENDKTETAEVEIEEETPVATVPDVEDSETVEVVVEDETTKAAEEEATEADSIDFNKGKWYAIRTFSGQEKKVKESLEAAIKRANMSDRIYQVLVPTENVMEMRDGKKRMRNKVFFPGYILIQMELDRETRYMIENTYGVMNFIGPGNQPQPLHKTEIMRILGEVDEMRTREVFTVPFVVGDAIRVTDGPFNDFTGFVQEINEEKQKVKVMVSIFGRATPVELDFLQVELEK